LTLATIGDEIAPVIGSRPRKSQSKEKWRIFAMLMEDDPRGNQSVISIYL
jgi:hypothetical protein